MNTYEIEINRINWGNFYTMQGNALGVPAALRDLLSTETSSEDSEKAYWGIENVVVVQGQSFSAALPVVSVIMLALTEMPILDVKPYTPNFRVKVMSMDLLLQIISGVPDQEEVARNNFNLVENCKNEVRKGLWYFYDELIHGMKDSALEILEIIETDQERLSVFMKKALNDKL